MELANEDYYVGGGEPPGQWIGRGAKELSLVGQVDRAAFYYLLDGVAPDGSRRLVQDSAGKAHHPGWDLTFSAPKSVSALWAVADAATRKEIERIHFRAVTRAIEYIEEKAAFTRRGPGGRRRIPVGLVVATFEHGTSRAQDPCLHSHCPVMNVGVLSDGSTGALDGRMLYRFGHAAGAVYRADLVSGMQHGLGLAFERRGDFMEIRDVPIAICRHWSTRRKEIEAALSATGQSGARASEIAALETRTTKEHIPRDVLLREWQEVGRRLGFSPEEAIRIRGPLQQHSSGGTSQGLGEQALKSAWDRVTEHDVRFTERELLQTVADECASRGVSGGDAQKLVERRLGDSSSAQRQGEYRGEATYASPEMLAAEARFLSMVERMAQTDSRRVGTLVTAATKALHVTMTDEQRRAVDYLTRGSGRMAVLDGWAGANRYPPLLAARRIWEHSDHAVIGVSPTARGVRMLEDQTGIHSITSDFLLRQLDPSLGDYLKYHARQVGRSLAGKKQYTPGQYFATLTRKTVLVIDQACWTDTFSITRLIQRADAAGAKVVTTGDRRAPGLHRSGNLFGAICDRVPGTILSFIERQRPRQSWARESAHDAGEGRTDRALKDYAQRGLLEAARTRREAMDNLVRSWSEVGTRAPSSHVMFASTAKELSELNRRAQAEMLRAGALGSSSIALKGVDIHAGDRVALMSTQRSLGITAGSVGKVLFVEPLTRNLVVWLEGRRIVGVPTLMYKDVALGYALPVQSERDYTAAHAYVLLNRNQEGSVYSALTRSRLSTKLFASRGDLSADLLSDTQNAHAQTIHNTAGRRGEAGPGGAANPSPSEPEAKPTLDWKLPVGLSVNEGPARVPPIKVDLVQRPSLHGAVARATISRPRTRVRVHENTLEQG
jgi:conjugative relaxase-like TrwC/TraI family protein